MPGFVGGLAEGLQGLPAEVGGILDAIRQRKAAAAISAWATAQGQPQGQPQGQQPQGQQPHPAAALAAMPVGPGTQPVSALSPAPAPFVPGKPPAAGQPDPLAPLPAAPQAQPKPGPDPSLSATAQPDQQFSDPMQEAQQTLGALIRSVKAANPNIDPRTLMDAVHTQLDEMKGILPTTKAVMQGQVQLLKSQMDMKFKYDKLNSENERFAEKMADLVKRHASLNELDAAREEHMSNMDRINQERTDDYGRSVDYGHEDRQSAESGRNTRASESNQTRRDIAGENNQTRRDISDQRSDESYYRSDQSYRGSQVRSGVTPDAPPPRRAGPSQGGAIPANVQQFAKQHGLTVIRRRKDGKYDARAKDGTVGVIG
jgi:hypothetical protein